MCESVHVQNVVISKRKKTWHLMCAFLSCSRFTFLFSADYSFLMSAFSSFLIKMSTEKICRHQLYTSYVNFLLFFSFKSTQVFCLFFFLHSLSFTSLFCTEKLNAQSLHVPLKIEDLKELQIPDSDNNFFF